MNTLLYCLISILSYFIIKTYLNFKFKKHECEHQYITVFVDTSDKIDLNYEFERNDNDLPKAKDILVAFERCKKCGHENVIISDGGTRKFLYNMKIYVAYCRDLEKKYELKKELNL